jgi:hypothetical protein
MKKRYFALAVAGLILGYFAKVNYWFEDERDVYFPITKEQLQSKVRAVKQAGMQNNLGTVAQISKTTGSVDNANPSYVDLARLSQNLLFNEIYNNKVLQKEEHQNVYFQMIQSRLSSEYPRSVASSHSSAYEREVANRLGLLRAMSHFWATPNAVKNVEAKQIKDFFHDVAKNKNENIMVRRQAYKNWLTFGDSAQPSEKQRLAANSDSRLLHLVSLSDESLIESLTETEQ